MNTILTLCNNCAEIYRSAPGVQIKEVTLTKTERKRFCEHCRRKGSFGQFYVRSGKR